MSHPRRTGAWSSFSPAKLKTGRALAACLAAAAPCWPASAPAQSGAPVTIDASWETASGRRNQLRVVLSGRNQVGETFR